MGVQCIYLRGIMIYMYALTGFFLSGKRKGGGPEKHNFFIANTQNY